MFPRQACDTYSGSVELMKRLTTIAISTIMYFKKACPEEHFELDNFEGIELRVLKKKCKDDIAQFVSSALINTFDAFDKKYLRKLVLCFHDSEKTVTEFHIFEFKYTAQKNSDKVISATFDAIRDSTIQFVRRCFFMAQTFKQYQESTNISLRLTYNEEAPPGYQVPGAAPLPGDVAPLEPLDTHIVYGILRTPFHQIKASSYEPDRTAAAAAGCSSEANCEPKTASLAAPIMTPDSENVRSTNTRRPSSPARQVAPSFMAHPINKVAEEGETVTLTCAVTGVPPPSATWDKDGVIIAPSSRVTVKEKDGVLRILQIGEVTPADVGVYRITIANDLGRAEAFALLKVVVRRGKYSDEVRPYGCPPRRSVVCCPRSPTPQSLMTSQDVQHDR